jgi:hypothetical protein
LWGATNAADAACHRSAGEYDPIVRRDTGSEVLPVEVFVSYTHVDEDLWKALGDHLSLLKRQQRTPSGPDRRIVAGAEWKGQIDSHLRSAGWSC